MSLSTSVIVRTEMVLEACLSMLGLDTDQWVLLVCDACTYWKGLLAVGEEELSHFGIVSSIEPADEARRFVEAGYIKPEFTYQELQEFTRSLIQRYIVLGMDRYGEIILAAEGDEEMVEGHHEDDDV